jgi:hypothetical protein
MTERKIVQIAVAQGGDWPTLYALCDDGTLWRHQQPMAMTPTPWARVPPIPEDNDEPEGS